MPTYIKTGLLFCLLAMAACTAQNKTLSGDKDVIQDTYWMLLSLEGQSVQLPANTRTAYLRFEEGKGEVNGYTGCNNFFGKFELKGDSVRLSDLGSTRMMCPAIDQETKFMRVLERVDSYSIADYLLTLYENGKAIATFRAGNDADVIGE